MSVFLYSCSEDEFIRDVQESPIAEVGGVQSDYTAGSQLQNPYTVANMQRALDSVKSKIAQGIYTYRPRGNRSQDFLEDFEIFGSHKYVKFVPQDDASYEAMKQDSTLILFDYPLDYDFPDTFFEDRADNATGDEIVEYYTTVAVDKSLPSGVARQEIAELYIPEQDPLFDTIEVQQLTRETTITNLEDFLHHLLFEAYNNTGNIGLIEDGMIIDPNNQQRIFIFGRRLRPSGRIRIWDERAGVVTTTSDHCTQVIVGYDNTPCLNGDTINCPLVIYGEECEEVTTTTEGRFVPVRGAQVLMRQFFTVAQGITDDEGNFTTSRIRGKAKYVVQWERARYSIRRGTVFQAEMKGPRRKDAPWYRDIRINEDRDRYHGIIHVASHRYFYEDRMGIRAPRDFGNMKIAARPVTGASNHVPFRTSIPIVSSFLGDIHIKEWGDPFDLIYGTTIHELAHAGHRNVAGNTYDSVVFRAYTLPCITAAGCNDPSNLDHQSARRLLETWATTVENEFTVDRYRNLFGVTNYDYVLNQFQNQTIAGEEYYTSAGIDMIDNVNQRIDLQNNNLPIDNVSGYSLFQLEQSLQNSNTFLQWRLNLADDYTNATEGALPQLFNNWN